MELVIFQVTKPFSFSKAKEALLAKKKRPYELLSHAISTQFPAPSQSIKTTPQNRPYPAVLHLAALSDSVQSPEEIWTDISQEDQEKLKPLLVQQRKYLEIIQQSAQGNMTEVIQKAQKELQSSALQSLIAPHITSAKMEIKRASEEGQSSSHWEKAAQFAQTAQLIAPREIEPSLLLGEIAIGEGFLDKAQQKFEYALSLDPENLSALNGMARVYGLRKDPTQIEYFLLKANGFHPTTWSTHHNLAVFYQEQGELEKAEALALKALTFSQQSEKVQITLITIHMLQEKLTLALGETDRLLQDHPSALAWFLRGQIHFELELWDKAEEDFRRATLADPNMHAARGSIGLIRIAQGDLDGAMQAFQSTLKFDPKNSVAKENIKRLRQEMAQ